MPQMKGTPVWLMYCDTSLIGASFGFFTYSIEAESLSFRMLATGIALIAISYNLINAMHYFFDTEEVAPDPDLEQSIRRLKKSFAGVAKSTSENISVLPIMLGFVMSVIVAGVFGYKLAQILMHYIFP